MNLKRSYFLFMVCVVSGVLSAHQLDFVDTRVGSLVPGLGKCLLGPCVPHGSVLPSPDTLYPYSGRNYAPANGYNHGDPVVGFSQFHAQGTGGHPSYGTLLVTPTCTTNTTESSLASPIILLETRPYLFRALLTKENITCSMSATHHCAIYEFTFPQGRAGRIHFNPYRKIGQANCTKNLTFERQGNTLWGGGTYSGNWVPGNYLCFFYGEEESNGNQIVFRLATSFKSLAKAKQNFAEVKGRSLAAVATSAQALWEKALSPLTVEGLPEQEQRLFYSHLYHTFIQPRDRTGDLARFDETEEMWDDHYTLWDSWKTLFPLMTLLDPKMVSSCVNSFVTRINKPPHYVGVACCAGLEYHTGQGGDEADNIIADAFVKKLPGINFTNAYQVLKTHAAHRTPSYLQKGYVAFDDSNHDYCWRLKSGSSTLGFAYNDFCASEVAKGLGFTEEAQALRRRSKNWKNVWHAELCDEPLQWKGFAQGRNRDGSWTGVTPREGEQNPKGRTYFGDFYEGSCWEYSYLVPGDIPELIELMGGKEKFFARLNDAFENNLINYTNEPSFLTPWLFNFVGHPEVTTRWAHHFRQQFTQSPCGLPGDDDQGAMSSLFVFLTCGMMPFCGQNFYALHAPAVSKSVWYLQQSGKTLTIRSLLPLDGSTYRNAFWNGSKLPTPFITHEQILQGGELVFQ